MCSGCEGLFRFVSFAKELGKPEASAETGYSVQCPTSFSRKRSRPNQRRYVPGR